MTSHKKQFRWIESDDDKFILTFALYDMSPQDQLQLCVQQEQMIQKQKIIGMYQNGSTRVELRIPFSGKVLKLLSQEKQVNNKRQLFLFAQCDHFPNFNVVTSVERCVYCQEELWSYQDKEEICYRRKDFKDIDEPNGVLQWNVKINQYFSKGEVIGTIGESEIIIGFRGRITYLSYSKNRDAPVLKVRRTKCKHQKILSNNICSICLQIVDRSKKQNVPIAVNNQDMHIQGRALQIAEKERIQHLLNNKKLILILDLDNTILHCQQILNQFLLQVEDYFLIPEGNYVVKMRPYLKYFLEKTMSRFDIYIYTKATREYAEKACEHIRKEYSDLFVDKQYQQYFTPKRIISRDEDSSAMSKSLKNVFSHEDYILILDDRKDVWNFSPGVIQTKEFKFFVRVIQTNMIFLTKVKDPYLYFTSEYLIKLHNHYFQIKSKQLNDPRLDVRILNKYCLQQRLKNLKIVFLAENLKMNRNFKHVLDMGAKQFKEEETGAPDLVIYSPTAKQLTTLKNLKYYTQSLKVTAVHEIWVDYCYQYNYKFKTAWFDVSQEDKITQLMANQFSKEEFEIKIFQDCMQSIS